MFLISSCNCLCPIHWSHVLSQEWRCSWSSADRQCSNYICVINNFITSDVSYIRGLMVVKIIKAKATLKKIILKYAITIVPTGCVCNTVRSQGICVITKVRCCIWYGTDILMIRSHIFQKYTTNRCSCCNCNGIVELKLNWICYHMAMLLDIKK